MGGSLLSGWCPPIWSHPNTIQCLPAKILEMDKNLSLKIFFCRYHHNPYCCIIIIWIVHTWGPPLHWVYVVQSFNWVVLLLLFSHHYHHFPHNHYCCIIIICMHLRSPLTLGNQGFSDAPTHLSMLCMSCHHYHHPKDPWFSFGQFQVAICPIFLANLVSNWKVKPTLSLCETN